MSKRIMPSKPTRIRVRSAPEPAANNNQPTVSARWIGAAVAIVVLAAALCVWGALCFTFWQGSWQLLYHPAAAITRTPANVGLAFDSVDFAATESGQPQIHGWWVPSASSNPRLTAIYLHGADGNIGNTVDALIPLHDAGVNILVLDYRGYGMSRFIHPSEESWREDAESAIEYLQNTRHIPASSLVIVGRGLGGNLALEVSAFHPEIAGVVLDNPLDKPTDTIFNDPRARLVPVHALVRDRWEPKQPATTVRVPSLWFYRKNASGQQPAIEKEAYEKVTARKMRVWLNNSPEAETNYSFALFRWLEDLPQNGRYR